MRCEERGTGSPAGSRPGSASEERRAQPVYLDRAGAEAKAREFLSGARTAADLAGRQVVLLAMTRYADEQAIAQSARSFYSLSPGGQLPWSHDVLDEDLDAIASERLPVHVLERGRQEREESAARRREAKETEEWYAAAIEGLEAMSAEQRKAVLGEVDERFEQFDPRCWQLRQRIEQLETGVGTPAETGADANDVLQGGEC